MPRVRKLPEHALDLDVGDVVALVHSAPLMPGSGYEAGLEPLTTLRVGTPFTVVSVLVCRNVNLYEVDAEVGDQTFRGWINSTALLLPGR